MKENGDILVVDDSAASLQLISGMLSGEGYSVRSADSGEQALSAAAAQPPELILMDVRMPGLDGFEVFERLKAGPGTGEVPVIFLTAATDPEECVAGLKLGAVDFITKPYDRESLLAKVRTHIELFRLRKKLEQQALELSAERDRFLILFQSSNDAVFVHALEPDGRPGKFTEVNEVACARLGYSRDELLGLTPADIDAAGMDEKCRAAMAEMAGTGRAVFEMVHAAKDGRKIPVEISSRVFSFRGRKQVLSIARDITERKRAEEDLKTSEKRLRAIVDALPAPMAMNDEKQNITLLNQCFLKTFGYAPEDIPTLAQWWPKAYPYPEYRQWVADSWQANLDKAKNTGEAFQPIELNVRCKNGEVKTVLGSASPLFDSFAGEHLVVLFDITDSKKTEAEHERLMKAIEQAGETIVITDLDGTIQYVNPAFEKITGYTRKEAVGQNPRVLKSGLQDEAFYKGLWEKLSSGETWEGRMVNKRKNGTLYTEEATISPVRDPQGRIINFVAVKRDITEQLKLETRMRQSQKMETIGLLAGGIAHDFNNILSAIICNAGFLAKDIAPDDPKQKDIKEIITSSERAASLTQQLLAFSRRQIMATRVVDINGLVGGMIRLLRRIIGEDIKVAAKLYPAACPVNIDPGQIEQVIMNLALNARDAMPGGGGLTLETEVIAPSEEFFDKRPDLARGSLVRLRVRDTGCGMNEEVKSHLFEPFFTTKEQGKGTGLGLSTVFGVVKQSGGEIEVATEPGKGTVFTIYLPLEEIRPQAIEKEGLLAGEAAGYTQAKANETVLLVEDEESLRRLGERILLSSGYTVLVAANGEAALELMKKRGKPVDALVSDVVMPGMSGRELGLELERRKLVSRAVYMSGYTDEAIVKHGVLEPGIAFIYKPYTVDGLLRKLREALDGPAGQAKV